MLSEDRQAGLRRGDLSKIHGTMVILEARRSKLNALGIDVQIRRLSAQKAPTIVIQEHECYRGY